MSAEQSLCTITSGHLGPINTASELQLCLFFFVPYCLFIIVFSLKSISSSSSLLSVLAFFLSHIHTILSLLFSLSACIHSSLYSSLSCPSTCISSPVCQLCICTYIHTQSFPPSWWPPCFLSCFFFLCCFHLSLLLTLVKTSSSPLGTNNSRAYLLFK